MASEQEPLSATVPVFTAKLSDPATKSSPTASSHPESDNTRAKSLKRSRPDQTHSSTNLTSIANAGLVVSPAKTPRFGGTFSPVFPAIPLTGAAAFEDERRRREEAQKIQAGAMSKNPGHEAITSLLAGGGMSKPQDAPVTTVAMSEGMSVAANALTIPTTMQFDERPETSPASVTSLASLGSTAQTVTASPPVVASPASMTNTLEAENRDMRPGISQLQAAMNEQPSNKSMTFPGNMVQVDPSQYPARGMSLPMPNQQLAPRSPSQKKHKCPYCETEFTRHHNLKSHLLTHSQEKPYVCQTCQMRFRRLHDLKRHMKLHTGERPHICPKCDRKFARGDALARHSKGLGGCAGRRASMGSFGGDDDFDGSNVGEADENGMDGIMYTNGTPHPNEVEMSEEDGRRFSLPSIKAQHVAGNAGSQDSYSSHSRTPSTYPPAGPRPNPPTGLYPPGTERVGSSSSATSPSMQNNVISAHTPNNSISSMPISTSGSMFSQSGMTESPKPLSPAGMHSHQLGHDSTSITRQRSPSLTTQFQQQHFGRHQSGRSPPPGMSLTSPHSTTQGPKLPALSGLAPPDTRFTLTSQLSNQQSPGNSQQGSQQQQQQQQIQQSTSPTSLFQPSNSFQNRGPPIHQGSGDSSNNLFASGASGVWAYVNTLEEKLKLFSDKVLAMEAKEKSQEDKIKAQDEKVNQLSEEVTSLRRQLSTQNQNQQPGTS